MANKYRLLPKAESDYFNVYAYSYKTFGERQAEKYISGLHDVLTLITEHNNIGRNISHIRAGYFRYEYEGHTVYYKHDQSEILIVRILGKKQDPLRHLLNISE